MDLISRHGSDDESDFGALAVEIFTEQVDLRLSFY